MNMGGYEDGFASNDGVVEQYFCTVHQMAYTPKFLEEGGTKCPKCRDEKLISAPQK